MQLREVRLPDSPPISLDDQDVRIVSLSPTQFHCENVGKEKLPLDFGAIFVFSTCFSENTCSMTG